MEEVFKWFVDGELYNEITSWYSEDAEGNRNNFLPLLTILTSNYSIVSWR